MTRLILKAVPVKLLDGVTAVAAGSTFALPVRASYLEWQAAYDVAPDAVNITLRVSIDGVVWTILDTTTATGGETRLATSPVGALFVDANVVTNTGGHKITVTLVAKSN